MKFAGTRKFFAGVFAGTAAVLAMLAGTIFALAGTQKIAEKLVPAGGIDFTESTKMLANPFMATQKFRGLCCQKTAGTRRIRRVSRGFM